MTVPLALDPRASLADLASSHAGASRVFQRHRLDWCCHGHASLEQACADRGLDPAALLDELAAEATPLDAPARDWTTAPLAELIEHILTRYHAPHRVEVDRLCALARKVEAVHAERPDCPRGLAWHLADLRDALESHMQKEEQILFPLIRGGQGRMAAMPISVMEQEHEDHAANLARSRALAHDFVAPPGACNTWRALYLGLAELERELMDHVHLENHVLFPRALRG